MFPDNTAHSFLFRFHRGDVVSICSLFIMYSQMCYKLEEVHRLVLLLDAWPSSSYLQMSKYRH